MTKKLTLTIDEDVIEKAKRYAKGTQRSLSEMIQKYLESLDAPEDNEELSPKMEKLLKMIPKDIPQYTDEELDNFRRDYLEKKYS